MIATLSSTFVHQVERLMCCPIRGRCPDEPSLTEGYQSVGL